MEDFYTIDENSFAEVTEKKSKFIASLFYVESQTEAEKIVKETKRKYHDARHNCVAYRIIENEKIIEKQSDDGEPSGTAGAPMLEILKGEKLCNVLVIVTRYFGGILLGTGGLVRAYSEASMQAIKNAKKVYKCNGYLVEVELEYKTIENFKYYCRNNNINIVNTDFSNIVTCKIELDNNKKAKLMNDIENKNINVDKLKVLCKKIISKSVGK